MRVNAVSAGPILTAAARGIPGFSVRDAPPSSHPPNLPSSVLPSGSSGGNRFAYGHLWESRVLMALPPLAPLRAVARTRAGHARRRGHTVATAEGGDEGGGRVCNGILGQRHGQRDHGADPIRCATCPRPSQHAGHLVPVRNLRAALRASRSGLWIQRRDVGGRQSAALRLSRSQPSAVQPQIGPHRRAGIRCRHMLRWNGIKTAMETVRCATPPLRALLGREQARKGHFMSSFIDG